MGLPPRCRLTQPYAVRERAPDPLGSGALPVALRGLVDGVPLEVTSNVLVKGSA